MRVILVAALCTAVACLTLNTVVLLFAETNDDSLPGTSPQLQDGAEQRAVCNCLCYEGQTKDTDEGLQIGAKVGPTLPQLDKLNFSKGEPPDVFHFLTREFVRKQAEERLKLLDTFIIPNENICRDAIKEAFKTSRCVRENTTTWEDWDGMGGSRLILMWIHSAPDHFERRRLAREIWASGSLYQHLGVNVLPVFAIGISENLSTHASVLDESSQYGDMVILNYTDVYHNISYKAVGGMRWISKYCPQARTYLKIDDDTLVIPHRLVRWIAETRVCHDSLTMRAIYIFRRGRRAVGGKWKLVKQEWPPRIFSQYSGPGLAYLVSTDLLPYLYAAIPSLPWIWLEDVWITGALRELLAGAGLPIRRFNMESVSVHHYEYIQNSLFKKFASKDICFVGEMPMNRSAYADVLQAAAL